MAEWSGNSSCQDQAASQLISKKYTSKPAESKEAHQSDGGIAMRDESPRQAPEPSNKQAAQRKFRGQLWNRVRKYSKLVALLIITICLIVTTNKVCQYSNGLSGIAVGPTAASGSARESVQQAWQLQSSRTSPTAQSMSSSATRTAQLQGGSSLVKLALDLNALPVCSADVRFSICKLATKSWLRLTREYAYIAPLMYLSAPASHGTNDGCKNGNACLGLIDGQIWITQRGEYTIRMHVAARCRGSKKATDSVSLKLTVNEKEEVQVPTACSSDDRVFTIKSSITLYLNPDDRLRVKLESVENFPSFQLEVAALHSMTFVQLFRHS